MRPDIEEESVNPYSLRQSWEPTFFRLQDVEIPPSLAWNDQLPGMLIRKEHLVEAWD